MPMHITALSTPPAAAQAAFMATADAEALFISPTENVVMKLLALTATPASSMDVR